jgi:hypothetical protein
MSIDYGALEKVTYDSFVKYGTTMYFYHKIDGEKNDVTSQTEYSTLVTKVKGIAINYGTLFVDGNNIQKGDKELLISTRQNRPVLGDEVRINDTLHRVINIKEVRPADQTIFYQVHVRSYAVGGAGTEDALYVKLGDLQEGSVVLDTNKADVPEWRVIAHNHYKAGYTVLIADKIFELSSFNGFETGATYPTQPWDATYMRRYLSTDFTYVLSAKMVANLTGMLIRTFNADITDKVTILSKVELTGEEDVGGITNGKYFPYFEANSSRIAYYTNPLNKTGLSTTYWTRDAKQIGSDGVPKIGGAQYYQGVRPVIMLNSEIKCIYNNSGIYEIQFE